MNSIRPSGVNVGVLNPGTTVYLEGNEDTDGSLRVISDENGKAQVELRANGVWNKAPIKASGDSAVFIGETLNLGAGGPFLVSADEASGETYIHARTAFDDATGTAAAGISSKLDPKTIRSIQQPDDSGATSSASLVSWTEAIEAQRQITRIYLDVAVAPGEDVTFDIKETDGAGNLLFSRRVSSDDLPTGEIYIDIPGWVHAEHIGEVLYFELAVDNSGVVSLVADVNDLVPWYAYDLYNEEHSIIAPMDVIGDSLIFERATHEHILTTDGNMVMTKPETEL